MNRLLLPLYKLIKSRAFWFFVGLALMPLIHSLVMMIRPKRPIAAFEAMDRVVNYDELKHIRNVTHFGYWLKFPGDRAKFERFVKETHLQATKVSDYSYIGHFGGSGWAATFLPEMKDHEIHFEAFHYGAANH
jgi:hypothetical protein